jgi:hypothetical protein
MDKEMPARSAWPAASQVGTQLFAHVTRNGQRDAVSGLSSHDQLTASPVNVIELKLSNLARTEPQTDKQSEDCGVAPAP